MYSVQEKIAGSASCLLRLCCYLFLRWIPSPHIALVLWSSAVVFLTSFSYSLFSVPSYEIISDDVKVVTKQATDAGAEAAAEDANGSTKTPLIELDVQETVTTQDKTLNVPLTLLLGLPSPVSLLWSFATLGINLLLLGMVVDCIYTPSMLYASQDLAFARIGYVSDTTASVLVREPNGTHLPIWVSYRTVEEAESLAGDAQQVEGPWKAAGKVIKVLEDRDYTATFSIRFLEPDTRYQYSLSNNHSGFFTTAPKTGQHSSLNDDKFTFVHTSCIRPRTPYQLFAHPLSIPGLVHLSKWLPSLRAQFMLFLGDFIYFDVPRRSQDTSVESFRRHYRQVYASPDWHAVGSELPWLHVLDDHEISNDWDANTTDPYMNATDPWHIYHTSINPPVVRTDATYFSFTQGPASFFLLDTRRYRDVAASAPADDPNKSMLGAAQLADLKKWLATPPPRGVRWKFIISSVPFTKNWRLTNWDTWAGYLSERQSILEAMWDVGLRGEGTGVVILSGDRHQFAATSFPPPRDGIWPTSSTVVEFSVSPLSMFAIPIRTYIPSDDEDVMIKYLPLGTSKFGAVELSSPPKSNQALLYYRLIVDGEVSWTYTMAAPPKERGAGRRKDALWG